jgi:TRAP-type transport system small permease protein
MFERVGKTAIRLLEVTTGAAVLAIAIILVVQVFSRYLFQFPLSWPEEVAGFVFVWLIFLGAPLAYWSGSLIGIHVFVDAMPDRFRTAIFVTTNIIVILFMIFLIFKGFEAMDQSWNKRTTVLQFSYAWIYVPLPIGAAALVVGYTVKIFERLRERRGDGSN